MRFLAAAVAEKPRSGVEAHDTLESLIHRGIPIRDNIGFQLIALVALNSPSTSNMSADNVATAVPLPLG